MHHAHRLHAHRYFRYDKDGTGLDRAALRTVLSDLGRLEGLRPADVEARLDQAFAIADRDGNGRISAHEFARWGVPLCVVHEGQCRPTAFEGFLGMHPYPSTW